MENPFSHLNDEKLMELYKNGEEMAFEVIYMRHKDRIYGYLDKRLSDKGIIEDIFQAIFVKFHRTKHQYDDTHPLLKWIYVICRSELLDALKKRNFKLVELSNEHLTEPQFEPKDQLDLDSFRSLTEKEKMAISLRFFADKEFDEIAKALSTSKVNSRKLISRGIKKIKAQLIGEKK